MDAGNAVVRADGWLWNLSNVVAGVAITLGVVLYVPPGTRSWNLTLASVDPFYLLVPLSLLYTLWCGFDLWRWYEGDDVL